MVTFFGFETSAVGRRMQSRAGRGLTTARDYSLFALSVSLRKWSSYDSQLAFYGIHKNDPRSFIYRASKILKKS